MKSHSLTHRSPPSRSAELKTSLAIFGPPGVGKTTLLKSLPTEETVCLDLEAGMKSVQDWQGASIPVRSFTDFRDLAVLIGGPDPAQHPPPWYGKSGRAHVGPPVTNAQLVFRLLLEN